MSLYLDIKYLNQSSYRFERFAKKGDYLWNMRCVICGDSQKNKLKARGYVFRVKDGLRFKCHNCSASMTFSSLLKSIDPNLFQEYSLEQYKEKHAIINFDPELPKVPKIVFKTKLNLDSVANMPNEHYAKVYLVNRKIPTESFSSLYFAPDFKKFIDELIPDNDKKLHEKEARIVIPFYDKNKELIAVQGRSLDANNQLRYIAIKVSDHPKIFGLDRFDSKKKAYVVEGPLDSLFLDNCLAAGGSNLKEVSRYVDINSTSFIYDNQPRNKDIVKLMLSTLESGYNVCIWPDSIEQKDINDMIMSGYTKSEIMAIVDDNTFSGIEGKLRVQTWKKC